MYTIAPSTRFRFSSVAAYVHQWTWFLEKIDIHSSNQEEMCKSNSERLVQLVKLLLWTCIPIINSSKISNVQSLQFLWISFPCPFITSFCHVDFNWSLVIETLLHKKHSDIKSLVSQSASLTTEVPYIHEDYHSPIFRDSICLLQINFPTLA